jgi:DNA polymerase-3 subunit epsilon
MSLTGQRSFEDLGTPLADVTFCVVDLETTGGSPTDDAITEVGAVKLRGGECLGTYQTLVNPGQVIPPQITVLTGITEAMVLPAPRIHEVLPSLFEFVSGTVIVGHNVRFDLGFLRAAADREGWPRLTNPWVDTARLARRLLVDEVPNCRLGTLASRLRLPHQPSHRALDDALATGDLLHVLLERAGRWGVLGLDDLLSLPTLAGHPQVAKLKLTNELPRSPGVYLFRDAQGRALYVGKASNLRSRVRSYFSGERRRKVAQLLRETHSVDHVVCHGPLEPDVLEVRLIHELQPRFNRQGRKWGSYAYLKLTHEPFPRLSVVRATKPDGGLYLGPLPSAKFAKRVAEAIESVVPIRRCTAKPGAVTRNAPCAPAQLGVATCPCAGAISQEDYRRIVERLVHGLTRDPALLLAPLADRMDALARDERFEEAADVRDRAAALAATLRRQRRIDRLRRAGRLRIEVPGGGGAEVEGGRLVCSWGPDGRLPLLSADPPATAPGPADPMVGPLPRELADELLCVARWLDERAEQVRLVHCDEGLTSELPLLPSYEPRRR